MRLNLHTDYALRVLMFLALAPGRLHTIEAVSARYGISRNHLMKVAQTLGRAGMVDNQRGRGGGMQLARPAAAILLGDVLRATEDNFALVECFDDARNTCLLAPACGLRSPLDEALAAFFAVLDGYSLADLVDRRGVGHRMRQLLGQAPMGSA